MHRLKDCWVMETLFEIYNRWVFLMLVERRCTLIGRVALSNLSGEDTKGKKGGELNRERYACATRY